MEILMTRPPRSTAAGALEDGDAAGDVAAEAEGDDGVVALAVLSELAGLLALPPFVPPPHAVKTTKNTTSKKESAFICFTAEQPPI
jgi:hypothetical protein